MSKFKENDRVLVLSGPYAGLLGTVERTVPNYGISLDEGGFIVCNESSLMFEDILNEPIEEAESNFSVDDYYAEMATIALQDGININISQEIDRLSIAYFKVYDHANVNAAKRVIRLHFKDSGMEYHRDPLGKQPWKLNSKDIKKIIQLLNKPYRSNKAYTNWQAACFQWNSDNRLIPLSADIDEYFTGKYDHMYDQDSRLESAYVPSTTKIPETWIYNK